MDYREHNVPAELRAFVRTIWTMRAPTDATPQRIVPDGCPEIILNTGDIARRVDGGFDRSQARALVIGQLTGAMQVVPTGEVHLIGIRFEPTGLFGLTGLPTIDLVHEDIDLHDLSPALHAKLWDASRRADHDEVSPVIDALVSVVPGHRRRATPVVDGAIRRLRSLSNPDIATLARDVGVSTRTLERRFRASVGVSPKFMHRVVRFAGVVNELRSNPAPGEAALLAARHGYYDQPHMIREFRSLAGVTPERFRREETPWSDRFLQPSG